MTIRPLTAARSKLPWARRHSCHHAKRDVGRGLSAAPRSIGSRCQAWRWASLLLLAAGCSRSGPELAPVSGRVLLDGVAVADAGVLFTPTLPGPSASGSTNEDGSFQLQTGNAPGALVGQHRVVISKAETRGVAADSEGLSGAASDGGWQFIEYLPAKYARPSTSGLTAKVESNMNNAFTFELTEKADE